jgi:hypothetical protein
MEDDPMPPIPPPLPLSFRSPPIADDEVFNAMETAAKTDAMAAHCEVLVDRQPTHVDFIFFDRTSVPPEVRPEAAPEVGPRLGTLSFREETGGRGVSTVSGGTGDRGGPSYGSFQMTSQPGGGTVSKFLKSAEAAAFAAHFDGLIAGSMQFSEKWVELATTSKRQLEDAEYQFIKRTHYDPSAKALLTQLNLDVSVRSATLRDVLWSTAVQHGSATGIFRAALGNVADGKDDFQLITGVYDERGREDANGLVHFRSSPTLHPGLRTRFAREKAAALQMLTKELAAR